MTRTQAANVTQILNTDEQHNILEFISDTVPTDTTSGYAKGCKMIKSDATDGTDLYYVNIGTADSCNFDVLTIS